LKPEKNLVSHAVLKGLNKQNLAQEIETDTKVLFYDNEKKLEQTESRSRD